MVYIKRNPSVTEYTFDTIEEFNTFFERLRSKNIIGVFANSRLLFIHVFNLPNGFMS